MQIKTNSVLHCMTGVYWCWSDSVLRILLEVWVLCNGSGNFHHSIDRHYQLSGCHRRCNRHLLHTSTSTSLASSSSRRRHKPNWKQTW